MKIFSLLGALVAICNTVSAKDVMSFVVRVEKGDTLNDLYCPLNKEELGISMEEYIFNRVVEGVEDYAKEAGVMEKEATLTGGDMKVTKIGDGHRVLFSVDSDEQGRRQLFCVSCWGGSGGRGGGRAGGGSSGSDNDRRELWSWGSNWWKRLNNPADDDRRELWSWGGNWWKRLNNPADDDRRELWSWGGNWWKRLNNPADDDRRELWSWGGNWWKRLNNPADDDRRMLEQMQDFEKQVSKTITKAVKEECEGPNLTIDIFIEN